MPHIEEDMKQTKSKKKHAESGFTLIEIMIVIAIIGVLAAIALPNFISYRNKAYCSAAEIDVQKITSAIATYFSDPANSTVQSTSPGMPVSGTELSYGNQYTLTPLGTSSYRITVTDATGNCPRFSTTSIVL